MRNFTKAVITSLALTAGVAGAANAANNWPGNTSNVCGGDKFNTCASINLTWTPIPQLDLVIEFLGGTRVNKDSKRGSSTQLQTGMTFRF